MCSSRKICWVVPFGGNGFLSTKDDSSEGVVITRCGISNWISSANKISLYFHSEYPGRALTALRLSVPDGCSTISVAWSYYDEKSKGYKSIGETQQLVIQGPKFHLENCGIITFPVAGYLKMELFGVRKTGAVFAAVTDALFLSENFSLLEEMRIRFVADPEDFYFGRRGPSVHLAFPLDETSNVEYFYNEIYVPKSQDVVGAYYCAIGFSGGYFGIQVNSEEERRILFSVWSEYDTNNPIQIPEDYKVQLIRSGEGVYVGEFGDEGAGAQSYLKYAWQSETTYKFIIQGKPSGSNKTIFSAWFNDGSGWNIIASFEKPKVATYVKGPYSFSENFIPDMGDIERVCDFTNQWARDVDGSWSEIRVAKFTADATAAKEARMDVSAGVGIQGNVTRFYLRNCGFFSDRVSPGTEFIRGSNGSLPPVDVSLLP